MDDRMAYLRQRHGMSAIEVVDATALTRPQALSEKYRPARIGQFLGLRLVKEILTRFVANPYPSAWLFWGASGLGKTTMAVKVAEAIPAQLHHIAAKSCKLETVEDVCHACHYSPRLPDDWSPARFHLCVVDEADQMTHAAQLAFLSKLDGADAPPNAIFVFTCNETKNLETRFLSRCRLIEFTSYGIAAELHTFLAQVWALETSTQLNAPDFAKIVSNAQNNVRSALNQLEIEIIRAENKGGHGRRLCLTPKLSASRNFEGWIMGRTETNGFTGEVHPIVAMTPEMSPASFEALKADIKEHGVKVPIWVYEGKILDGRARWRACQELGIDCPIIQCTGPEPLTHIVSLNLVRRHLDESQRAVVAARIVNMSEGRPRKTASSDAVSGAKAAQRLNVSIKSVERAKKVLNSNRPDLVAAVVSGEISISKAAKAISKAENGPKPPTPPTQPLRESALANVGTLEEDAVWLWKEIALFQESGIMNRAPADLLSKMTEEQSADVFRLVPALTAWLQGFPAAKYSERDAV